MTEVSGERMVPGQSDSVVEREHWARYKYAAGFAMDKEVLDIACGSGYGSKLLAEAGARRVLGMDLDADAIRFAKEKYQRDGVTYEVGNAEDLNGVPSDSLDLVVSFETIEHLPNVDRYLAELRRVLRPGGTLLVSTPDRRLASVLHVFLQRPQNRFHLREYTESEFIEVVGRYFTVEETLGQSFVSRWNVWWPFQFAVKSLAKLFPGQAFKSLKGRLYEDFDDSAVANRSRKGSVPKYWVLVCKKP